MCYILTLLKLYFYFSSDIIRLLKVKAIVNGGFEMISTFSKQIKILIIFLVAVSLVAIASGVVLMVFNTSNSGNTSIKYTTTFFLRNEDSKYALFNEDGERLTEFVYTSPSDFMNGTAEVSLDDKVGIIDENGKMTVDFGKYDSITNKNGVYEVRDKDSKSYLINGNGKVLYTLEDASLHTYTDSDYYSILEDRKAKKYYVLGSNGEELESFDITSNEDVTTNVVDNYASIFYNGKNYIFDLTTGKEIITFNDSEHYCVNRVSDDRKTLILNSCGSSNSNNNAIYKILVNNKLIDISNECDNAFFKDGKIICTKDYEEYLRKLRGLKIGKAEVDPPSRAVHHLSHAGYQHQAQHPHGQDVEYPVKIGDPHIIDQGGDDHKDHGPCKSYELAALVGLVGAADDEDSQEGNSQHEYDKGKFIIFQSVRFCYF